MRTNLGRIGVGLMGVAGLSWALADEPTPLRNDPFLRPQLTAVVSKSPAMSGLGATSPDAGPLVTWGPRLKAVLVAGDRSLVNLDGTIVRLGEEVDGYRLVQVQDSEAIFRKAKQRVVLKMGSSASRQTNERSAP